MNPNQPPVVYKCSFTSYHAPLKLLLATDGRPCMPTPGDIKPKHKAIAAYCETLREFSDQQVKHEAAVETAFGHAGAGDRGWDAAA